MLLMTLNKKFNFRVVDLNHSKMYERNGVLNILFQMVSRLVYYFVLLFEEFVLANIICIQFT